MRLDRSLGILLLALPLFATGCIRDWLPPNLAEPLIPPGEVLQAFDGAVLKEVGGPVPRWLEVRPDDDNPVGGYISPLDDHNGGLVVLLDGASAFHASGELGSARAHFQEFGADFREAGWLIWSLAVPEGLVPWGEQDLPTMLNVLDWLEATGRDALDVDRVYLIGYSSGATLVNMVNLEREVDAIVSMAGMTQPDQLLAVPGFYALLYGLFADNTAFAGIGTTLFALTVPDSRVASTLDMVGRLEEVKNPTLFLHGTADPIMLVSNATAVEERYRALRAAGVELPPLTFHYIEAGDHFMLRNDPLVRGWVIEYLQQFEPRPGAPAARPAD